MSFAPVRLLASTKFEPTVFKIRFSEYDITENITEFRFYAIGCGVNTNRVSIDWGDGTTELLTCSGTGTDRFVAGAKHTYSVSNADESFTITLDGRASWFALSPVSTNFSDTQQSVEYRRYTRSAGRLYEISSWGNLMFRGEVPKAFSDGGYCGAEYDLTGEQIRWPASVFTNCSSLTSVAPRTFSYIPPYAFASCYFTGVGNFVGPSTKITDSAFEDSSVTAISWPESQSIVPPNCFKNAHDLVSVNGVDKVSEIGDSAFYYCNNLSTVSFSSCTSVGIEAFAGSGISDFKGFPAVESFGKYCFSHCANIKSLNGFRATTIPFGCFQGCKGLSVLEFPENIERICSWAFDDSSFSVIKLGGNISVIDQDAFGINWTTGTLYSTRTAEQLRNIIGANRETYGIHVGPGEPLPVYYKGSDGQWNEWFVCNRPTWAPWGLLLPQPSDPGIPESETMGWTIITGTDSNFSGGEEVTFQEVICEDFLKPVGNELPSVGSINATTTRLAAFLSGYYEVKPEFLPYEPGYALE